MKTAVKIKFKKLNKYPISGNFLYKKDDICYFSDRLHSSLYLVGENATSNESLNQSLESHLADTFEVYSNQKNRPSFYLFNTDFEKQIILEKLNKNIIEVPNKKYISLLEKETAIFFSKDEDLFIDTVENLIENRSGEMPSKDIFIVLNKPEDLKIKKLSAYLTLARSRRIFFVVIIQDKALFEKNYSPEDLEIVKANCYVTFNIKDNKVSSFETR